MDNKRTIWIVGGVGVLGLLGLLYLRNKAANNNSGLSATALPAGSNTGQMDVIGNPGSSYYIPVGSDVIGNPNSAYGTPVYNSYSPTGASLLLDHPQITSTNFVTKVG